MKHLRALLLAVLFLAASFFGVQAETISSAKTTIVYPVNGTLNELLAAKEVRRYVYLRSGQLLDAKPVASLPASGGLIVVAANGSTLLASLREPIAYEPTEGQTLLKSVAADGRNILVVSGADADATLLAAYRYAEKIGVGFDLAGDSIPDALTDLSLSGFDEVGRPLFETRGILPFHDFFQGPDLWNTCDYRSVISQLPKLGMNFIGLKTYPHYSTYEERVKEFGPTGPELTVWIGLPEDVNPDGTVKWSYPAYFAHTKRPNRIWGSATLDTDRFSSPARHIFDRNDYGPDVMGTQIYTDLAGRNEAFNRTGAMFKNAFAHAKQLGVKTAVATELPMGLEKRGPEVQADWVRGMPPALQDYLKEKGLDPKDPKVVKDIYKGIFTRIMRTHDLDYYWLWTWEVWQSYDMTRSQVAAIKQDIALARQALDELGNPFQIAMAGWKIGTGDNPAEFDDPKLLPYEAPIMGLWHEAESFEDLSRQRKKWPCTWFEEDWGLAVRTKMARLWETMMRLHLEKVTNASDLGEIVSLEILNWHQLVVLKWDKLLERGLRKPIPGSANPSTVYDGAPLIRVLGTETQINKGQPLELSVIALGTGDTPPILKVRPLGRGAWQDVPVAHKARRVYSAAIPPQADDFEYYLESGDTKFPVTAGSASPIYQTVVVAGEAE